METVKITWSHYYGTLQKISLLAGLWPFLQLRTRLFRIGLQIVNMITISVPQMAFQFRCRDIHCFLLSLTAILLSIVAVVKVYTFQLNILKFKELTEHLYVDWKNLETPEEYEIMKSYAENSRRFSIIYPVYCIVGTTVFMSVSIVPHIFDVVLPLNESRPLLLPYPGYYFVDSREYFTYIFWHSFLSWQIVIIGIFAHDCMFVCYVEHVSSMFAVVGYRFESLIYDRKDALSKNENADLDEKLRRRVAYLVHTHREALELAQLLESIFNIPFAVQMGISTVGMSITLLQGQKLLDRSIETRDKIYNSSWYKTPRNLRKLLILIMMKSLQPSLLTAGKIYIFSLENFATVLQTSMSYFTVLASF
ncbi:putative odorant receptor 85d [Harpegnathos saltator]|uniref:putative odorant receptor 85d n=1 Tax=Harpegnathos saltator TaxID=610380 RepID=UPI000948DB90|nr:putative odorant receptor 85d [Harpegnathos saltator]